MFDSIPSKNRKFKVIRILLGLSNILFTCIEHVSRAQPA